MRLPSRLTLHIYAVSVVQLLVVAGAIALIGWLSFRGRGPGEFHGEGQYAVESVALVRDDPARMQREADRVLRSLQGKLTLYTEAGQLLVSNVTPPLPALGEDELRELRTRGELLRHGHPPRLAVRLPNHASGQAYGLFVPGRHPPPPPRALWGLLVAMIGAAIAAVVLARSFARPLRTLTVAARAFGAGDLSVRAGMQRRDEFGELPRPSTTWPSAWPSWCGRSSS
jgi:methyl-accepting chemotaxis protein